MRNTPQGMTQIEWMGEVVPEGDRCGGCKNVLGGKCTTWGQDVTSDSKKCDECQQESDMFGSIWWIKQRKKQNAADKK